MSLMDAAQRSQVPDVDADAYMASEVGQLRARDDPHKLTADEGGALTLYTMEGEFYPTLNRLLRVRDRTLLGPFLPYLRLMVQARDKLPRYKGLLWRGVKGVDLRGDFPVGKELFWWSFSSTTKQMSTLQNPQFLGTDGVRTVFSIQVKDGVDIARYSIFQGAQSEAEVLLYPGTKLRVVDTLDMGHSLFAVHLEQVPLAVDLFK
mmetsp:Transcript_5769/g.11072  ORF Transcript_5769/g.11072 Transcript_5769/m.11072 type:complete len:205 (-) Transcript_5769:245-859(-)